MCNLPRTLLALGVILVTATALWSQEAAPIQPPPADPAPANPAPAATANPANAASLEQLTERVRKSVAVVMSAGRDGRKEGIGSGFVIAADGLIATNYHVIGDGRAVEVQLADGRKFDVTAVHASDRALDLAIIKIDAKDLPVLDLGNSDELKQGQSVVALGNPRGLKNSVVSGIVSGVREMEGRPMIQLAMPIEPGNSGGPLVDMQGRVQGVLTMKSLVTPNLGFALTVNLLKPLVAKPNPIPMSRWLTIGALDPREWQPLFGARWRQRAGRISVDGQGAGFGGRSLCLAQREVPERPFEISVRVQLSDERGAAGLVFSSDGEQRHYGFYPTNGSLRLTRFDGPDVLSWNILFDQPSKHYVAGGWNTLKVRMEEGKIRCFVNDQQVVEIAEATSSTGQVGLVKFRDTEAQFKLFQLGRESSAKLADDEERQSVAKWIAEFSPQTGTEARLVDRLVNEAPHAVVLLRERADQLEKQAEQLRQLAETTDQTSVINDLVRLLSAPEEAIDLVRACLLVARLDNDEVDVEAYRETFERMGRELVDKLPADADETTRLATLRKYLFEENGFHGSRGDYYHRANSYLNEVLDDREGLPITLSIVYLELAARMGVKVVGVGLPGHFVVRHVPRGQGDGPDANETKGDLIDVYESAAIISREEAERRVKAATDAPVKDEYFAAMTKRAIVSRMLHNLLSLSSSDFKAMHRYLNALLALNPHDGQKHWLRAVVRYQLHQREGALEDVAWLLENKPEDADLGRVLELRQALERQQ